LTRPYYLFLSHTWSEGEDYERLTELLNARTLFTYKIFMVSRDDPIHHMTSSRLFPMILKREMKDSQVVIIQAGKCEKFRNWVNVEIQVAQKEFPIPKPILVIKPWYVQYLDEEIRSHAEKIVDWDTESIVKGIQAVAL
jgi:hypothetical protein